MDFQKLFLKIIFEVKIKHFTYFLSFFLLNLKRVGKLRIGFFLLTKIEKNSEKLLVFHNSSLKSFFFFTIKM